MYLSYDIDFNICDLCDALFSLCRVGGAKNSFSMVYKFPVKYSSLEMFFVAIIIIPDVINICTLLN